MGRNVTGVAAVNDFILAGEVDPRCQGARRQRWSDGGDQPTDGGRSVLVPDNAVGGGGGHRTSCAGPPAICGTERPRTVVTAADGTAGLLSSLAQAKSARSSSSRPRLRRADTTLRGSWFGRAWPAADPARLRHQRRDGHRPPSGHPDCTFRGTFKSPGSTTSPTLRDHSPGPTTVRLPLEAMGERIVEIAMSTDLRPGSAAVERVPAEVILRDSTDPG